MSHQLRFDLPGAAALGAADFFLSPANRTAFRQVTEAAAWPHGKLALIGPPGSGKSHLVRIWQAERDALVLTAADIAGAALPAPGRAVAVEDADRLPATGEEALFHLHNHVLSTGGRLLLTGRRPPAEWPIALPDLVSRMLATALARIGDPDDALLSALLTKLFADRQLSPGPGLLPYLVTRLERSYLAAQAMVAALDDQALAQGREISRALAREVLDKTGATPDEVSQSLHQAPP